jgi:hypothetical protein
VLPEREAVLSRDVCQASHNLGQLFVEDSFAFDRQRRELVGREAFSAVFVRDVELQAACEYVRDNRDHFIGERTTPLCRARLEHVRDQGIASILAHDRAHVLHVVVEAIRLGEYILFRGLVVRVVRDKDCSQVFPVAVAIVHGGRHALVPGELVPAYRDCAGGVVGIIRRRP